MSGESTFNVKEHLEYRHKRYKSATIDNPMLLGLSTVEINPTELCNRVCSFCPRSDPKVYPNRKLHMTVVTAELISQQLKDAGFDGDIHITGFGEPTLNPCILSIIKSFSKNFFTEMITNGDRILTGKLTPDSLWQHGLDSLIVDCYDNEEQVDKITNILKDFKGQLRIRKHFDDGSKELFQMYNYNNRGGMMNDPDSTHRRPCYMPMYKSFIDWNGDVRLCCNDWARAQKPFGNIHKESFSEIWMNNMFTKVRKTLLRGERDMLPACELCDTDGCKGGKESAVLWNTI